MVQERTIASSPEQLDAWISQNPDARKPLEDGEFGTEITVDDLFRLLQGAVTRAGRSTATAEARPRTWKKGWPLVGIVAAPMVVLTVLAM